MGRGWRFLLLLVVTVPVLWAAYAVRTNARADCELLDGFLPGADLAVRGLLAALAAVVVWALLESARRPGLALACAALVTVVGAWVMVATTTPPPGYPNASPACVGNLPDWWPGWLPS